MGAAGRAVCAVPSPASSSPSVGPKVASASPPGGSVQEELSEAKDARARSVNVACTVSCGECILV